MRSRFEHQAPSPRRLRATAALPSLRHLALGVALLASACSDHDSVYSVYSNVGVSSLNVGGVPGPANVDELFAMSHLVEVEIEIAPADWDALRHEGREMLGVFDESQRDYEYTYFDATVTVDGVRHESVGLRKKGYWGSLSVTRPSLKIDLDRYIPSQTHLGLGKLTLNNDRGDPSRTHECMAYALFASAGVPASRCNLAHVMVNGEDLGTYSHVESVEKQMLARHFEDNEGNLYEGQLADVTRARADLIELKTNKKENDRSGLLALVDALEADDSVLLEQLSGILDVDRFRDFWAMELLAGHWDGYANNANNYMAYHDRATGLFHFLPWGTDNTFERTNPRNRVYAWGSVASRLYGLPEQRDRFWARLAELADSVWDTPALLAHIDQVAAFAPDVAPELLDAERQHVTTRVERLRATLGGTRPRPRARVGSPCGGTLGDIAGTFATSFRDLGVPAVVPGTFTAELTLDGEPVRDVTWSGDAGVLAAAPAATPTIRYRGTLADNREISLDFTVEPSTFKPGSRRFHGGETYGLVNARLGGVERYVGPIGSGDLNLVEADTVVGAAVRGSFSARIYQFGCAWR